MIVYRLICRVKETRTLKIAAGFQSRIEYMTSELADGDANAFVERCKVVHAQKYPGDFFEARDATIEIKPITVIE